MISTHASKIDELLHQYLVQAVERPIRGAEGGEDGPTEFEAARPDLEGALQDLDGVRVAALGEQLLPDHGDDDEGRFVQFHRLQLTIGGLQGT